MIRKSDSELMHFLNLLLFMLSAGTQRTFMTSFTTVIGHTVYTPEGWGGPSELPVRHPPPRAFTSDSSWRYTRPLFTFLYLLVLH